MQIREHQSLFARVLHIRFLKLRNMSQ